LRLILILGDGLNHHFLKAQGVSTDDVLLMVESLYFVKRKPYHRKKIVLVWSAMRTFAEELRQEGYTVDYRRADDPTRTEVGFTDTIADAISLHKADKFSCLYPRERGTRALLRDLFKRPELSHVEVASVPDPFWYTPHADFKKWLSGRKSPKMEDYYRDTRRRTGILMNGKEPEGGEWNYDHDNRKPFPKKHVPAPPFCVEPSETVLEVMRFVDGIEGLYGKTDGFAIPVSRKDALEALNDFVVRLLPNFGMYEDAMAQNDAFGYHSVLSPLINLGILSPQECVDAVLTAYAGGNAPLNSVEGFVRQIVGWREYMYHQFEAYFDGGRDYHTTNTLEHHTPLPGWYWTGKTEMNCLHTVIGRVLEHAYSHHIERLMVLGNFALLAGIDPHQLNDWFWALYLDAYEWAVTPNVVGMSQFADGGWIATKPYVSSGAYIDRMSDYCKGCRYDPKQFTGEKACPFTTFYWDFLLRHETDPLSVRMTQNLFGLRNKTPEDRDLIRVTAIQMREKIETL